MANNKHKRHIKIILCTDPMSSMIYDNDQDKEYDAIEQELKEILPNFKITFVRNIFPHQLANENFDVYLFDFGGMLPGCEDMIRQVEDHPNSAFILYSSFSVRWYEDCMADEAKDIVDQPNVILYDYNDKWIDKITNWLELN